MLLKFLLKLLVFVFANSPSESKEVYGEGPNTSNETVIPVKYAPAVVKKDSIAQTQSPIVIFKLINTNFSTPVKNTGSLKNAGKVARTANTHGYAGKI